MRILLRIGAALAAVVVVVLLVAALQPAQFTVERSISVAAPPAALFAQVDDFHRWGAWSPWEKVDPGMKRTYGGAAAGTGATYAWDGNAEIGAGRMTILESRPDDLIRIRLEFLRPFESNASAEFTFVPEGGSTTATWRMVGENNFLGKLIGLFLNMDKMVGGQFEQGLADLKKNAEAAAHG